MTSSSIERELLILMVFWVCGWPVVLTLLFINAVGRRGELLLCGMKAYPWQNSNVNCHVGNRPMWFHLVNNVLLFNGIMPQNSGVSYII